MIVVDTHESNELYALLGQAVAVERQDLNGSSKPDLLWFGRSADSFGIENKQNGEILGGLDSCEEQLGRQMHTVDNLMLSVRGPITATEDGLCQTWKSTKGGELFRKDRVYRQQYIGYRAWIAALWREGIAVIEVPDLRSLVTAVIATYNDSQKEEGDHKTFRRLVRSKYWLTEEDKARKDFMLTLMGISGAGVGEEVADAVCTWLKDKMGHYLDLYSLIDCFRDEPYGDTLPDQPLRSSLLPGARKRTIGPAAVAKLKGALGL